MYSQIQVTMPIYGSTIECSDVQCTNFIIDAEKVKIYRIDFQYQYYIFIKLLIFPIIFLLLRVFCAKGFLSSF